jgi:hypothetical protein
MKPSELTQKRYPVDRPLTTEERKNQLHQKERLDVQPVYNAPTRKFISTYVEMVDRWFYCRGTHTGGFLFLSIAMVVMVFIMAPLYDLQHSGTLTAMGLLSMGVSFCAFLPLWAWAVWLIRKEAYCWTHYPIRFNRKNRMVYVFGFAGIVRSAKWDDLFFTLGRSEFVMKQQWDIRGHVLKADKETVEWSFALHGESPIPRKLKMYWEFVRRYMEEGPASVHDEVFWCHDIATKRETFRVGRDVVQLQEGRGLLEKIFFLFFWSAALARSFVMRTSKIPVWPDEVEALCKIEPNDAYVIDASNNPDRFPYKGSVIA